MVRVLSCSPNLELARLRAAVLKTADCDVECPESQTEALDIMKQLSFDVLLICYEYSDRDGEELCNEYKKHNPDGRIIVLVKSHREPACDDIENRLHALDGPGALIRTVLATV
jgi:CheY-like chemotaxis protein